MDDSNPVCAISGGSRGIGLATAVRFASDGYRVSICGRDPERLNAAREQLVERTSSDAVMTAPLDLRQSGSCEQWIEQTHQQFGRIDVLVNNAGAAFVSPLGDMTDEQFRTTMELNVHAVFALTRSVWRIMQEQGSGTLVNISSLAAIDPFPGFSVYGATKSWLELFSRALATEGKPLGIRSYVIRPGTVETPLLRRLFPDFPAEQCVAPLDVAEMAWQVCQPPFLHSSGSTISVSKQ